MSRPNALSSVLDAETVRRLTRQIDQACDLMGRLSGSPIPAADFFLALTTRTLSVINGTAGAVWLKSPQGLLQLQHQTNLGSVGIEDLPEGRGRHNALLKHTLDSKQLTFLDTGAIVVTAAGTEASNAAAYPVVVAPILSDQGDTYGLFEVWLESGGDPKLRTAHINFVNHMAGYATNYLRNNTALRNSTQEQIFTQLEAFSRQIHASLNPTEVAFLVANEGRRLIGCDRICVGVRHGRRTTIEAVSGSDVVEKASVQVRAMRDLMDAVLDWNERLLYQGSRDETLPPPVLHSLDAFLAQSNPKLLVLQPLRDERELQKDKEKDPKPGPARSALLLEAFEPPEKVDPMLERFEIVASHAASSLYNAAEMKRIPFAFIWKPILALQGRAGGKRRFYTMLALGLVTAIMLAMFFVPYPLKLDAKGQLEPEEWNYIYPTGAGRVVQFKVTPGQTIRPNTPIAVLVDHDLGRAIDEKLGEIRKSEVAISVLGSQAADSSLTPTKQREKADELKRERDHLVTLNDQLNLLLDEHRADISNPGQFTVFAPEFRRSRNSAGPTNWKVVSADFEHQLVNRWMRQVDPLLRVGNTSGVWRIEQKIPQKHVSQLLRAYSSGSQDEFLEVDVLVTSAPTQTFKGRLYRRDISGEAVQNKDDHNESELVVYAYVRVNEPGIPPADQIPTELLVTGVEVHTKIRCGNHSLGYSLFHGAWEFIYEHVIFAF
ncbi:MAG: hypothetical protein K8T89_22840 [Planctomycetes bacterium]|nr:hypothetical protein [Planctomycetota bacterium]